MASSEPAPAIAVISAESMRLAAPWRRLLSDVAGYRSDVAGDLAALKEQLEAVTEQMRATEPDALAMVALRYGLGGERPGTLEEVGRRLHYSRARVRQVEQKVIRSLRHPRHMQKIQAADFVEGRSRAHWYTTSKKAQDSLNFP